MGKKKVTKRAAAPARKSGAAVAKIGESVIIDGHAYEIVALDAKRNVFEFARPDGQGKGSTDMLRGLGNISDITAAEEGFLYLPNRITPKLDKLVQAALAEGMISEEQAAPITLAIRNHPQYVDRDDIAVRQVGEIYGLDFLQLVPVRNLIAAED